ncbi:MAG: hypothetical protein QXK17_03620 [Metallosphaera sp.]
MVLGWLLPPQLLLQHGPGGPDPLVPPVLIIPKEGISLGLILECPEKLLIPPVPF